MKFNEFAYSVCSKPEQAMEARKKIKEIEDYLKDKAVITCDYDSKLRPKLEEELRDRGLSLLRFASYRSYLAHGSIIFSGSPLFDRYSAYQAEVVLQCEPYPLDGKRFFILRYDLDHKRQTIVLRVFDSDLNVKNKKPASIEEIAVIQDNLPLEDNEIWALNLVSGEFLNFLSSTRGGIRYCLCNAETALRKFNLDEAKSNYSYAIGEYEKIGDDKRADACRNRIAWLNKMQKDLKDIDPLSWKFENFL
jgi:hypothetical protein